MSGRGGLLRNVLKWMFIIAFMAYKTTLSGSPLERGVGHISFLTDRVDFGSVLRGSHLSWTFHFMNQGSGDVRILEILPGCACIVPEESAKQTEGTVWKPGESGELSFRLLTDDLSGHIPGMVTIRTDEALTPDRTLILQAYVVSDLLVLPDRLVFDGALKEDEPLKKSLRLIPAQGVALKITGMEYNRKHLNVSAQEDGKQWLVQVELLPGQSVFRETLLLRTNLPQRRELAVRIQGRSQGAVFLEPEFIEFGQISRDHFSRRLVRLNSDQKLSLQPKKTEMFLNGQKMNRPEEMLQWSFSYDQKISTLELSLQNTLEASGAVHGTLFFEGVAGKESERKTDIELDFYGFFQQ